MRWSFAHGRSSRLARWCRAGARAWPAILVLACSPGESPVDPDPQPVQYGSLTVDVGGLPGAAAARVTVTGPGGYAQTLTGPASLTQLTAGSYTITASDVTHDGSVYAGTPAAQTVNVPSGGSVTASPVTYALASGALSVQYNGLPAGTDGLVIVSGPNGFGRTLTSPETLTGLAPGTYTVVAQPVGTAAGTWTALVPQLAVQVSAVPVPSAASFAYSLATGSVAISVAGLPNGTPAAVQVTGPAGYHQTLAASTTISNLQPGTYTVTGDPVLIGPDTWRAGAAQNVTVVASATPAPVTVTYALATGRLTVTATGQPPGSNPTFQVTGPAGFSAAAASGITLTGLAPGAYTVTAAPVGTGAATYAPTPATQQVTVTASTTPAVASVTYALASGSLTVTVTGLPQGVGASITISGPNGFAASLTGTATLDNLAPGAYTVTAAAVTSGIHVYRPAQSSQVVTVPVSLTPAPVAVPYALSSGLIAVTVTGLPPGVPASVTVTGPNGYQQSVTVSTTLTGLAAGTYQVNAAVVTTGGTYAPSPASQSVVVVPSTTAVPANVSYAPATTSLTVTVNGLPLGVSASISVTGPGGYAAAPTATQTFSGIPTGTYTITANVVGQACASFTPTPLTQQVQVNAGMAAGATVDYSSGAGSGLNLCIDGAYVTQSVQTFAGTVPLVAGRAGLLRVFVKASQANSVTPSVRARFYNGAVLVNTITIPAPGGSVPLASDESALGASWNATLTGALLQPGLRLLVDVDPSGAVAESNETDNTLPANGTPASLDIRTVSPLQIRLVPVTQSGTGQTGNASDGNKASFIDPMLRMYPIVSVDADVHGAYLYTGGDLQSSGTNWNTLLSEINALRVAEGTSRHYYGVVKVGYSSGVAGLGYIGLPAAIGWDYLPSGAGVLAHEVGHNLGRYHAPCGGPSGVDANWPHSTNPNAIIGSYGYDITGGILKNATTEKDLMSYCNPEWISDYTYRAILDYRASHPMIASASVQARSTRGLLIWGRIERGQPILEPAIEVDAPPTLPSRSGPHRIDGFGPAGEALFSLAFAGDRIADGPDPNEETFAFVVPMTRLRGAELARLRLAALGRQAEVRGSGAGAAVATALRQAPGRVRVTWDRTAARVALVRDARTGQVLSFARGGSIDLPTTSDDLDITLSDGVRSFRTRVRPK